MAPVLTDKARARINDFARRYGPSGRFNRRLARRNWPRRPRRRRTPTTTPTSMRRLADVAIRVAGVAIAVYLFGVPLLVLVSVYNHPSWLLAGLTAAFVVAALAIRRLG